MNDKVFPGTNWPVFALFWGDSLLGFWGDVSSRFLHVSLAGLEKCRLHGLRNHDFMLKNVDFMLNSVDLLLKNVGL